MYRFKKHSDDKMSACVYSVGLTGCCDKLNKGQQPALFGNWCSVFGVLILGYEKPRTAHYHHKPSSGL
jgi:hypothetical protein